MSLGISLQSGVVYLEGHINENASFAPIPQDLDPLRLHMGGIRSINSMGVQKFLQFISTWGRRAVEYHDLPVCLVDACVMLPALLGPEENTARIVSLEVPYEDPRTGTMYNLTVAVKEIRIEGNSPVFPPRVSPETELALRPSDLVDEYDVLVAMGAFDGIAVREEGSAA